MSKIDKFDGPYRFLSNFWPSPVMFCGDTYHTVEHAYQAAKTLDLRARAKFRDGTITAGMAKRMGKELVLRPNWDIIKTTVMECLIKQKFRDKTLKQMLLETAPALLIEGNTWHDRFWGECYCPNHKNNPGKNNLGTILMRVRDELGRV
jgi:ribA/ribD-fused uncharacterized protein